MGGAFCELSKKIKQKKIKIAVVGLGYVGLPLAIEFAKKGLSVLGIEIDKGRLGHIKRKESYISDISAIELRRVINSGNFRASSDFRLLKNIDVVLICVPTPLKRKYHPDISYIKQAVKNTARRLKRPSLIILESTTYPGTTEEVILPLIEKYRLKHGEDFYLCFSPERIDPGNKHYPVHKIPKVVGGINKQATTLAELVYSVIIEKVVPVSSCRAAEITKLLENTFRLINIGLIDEIAMMAHKMGIDIWEVIAAAKTKPFGFMPFYPGPGVGGHCLDKDETVFVKDKDALTVMRMPDFINHIRSVGTKDAEVLSFDPIKGHSVFRKVTAASARPYSGSMLDISTEDGRHLKVTDLHPMFIRQEKSWQLKYAKDLKKGDALPICLDLPQFNATVKPWSFAFKGKAGFATVKVKEVTLAKADMVYSIETAKPHSFVTSYGIVVHNCIPKDPLYLYWKAKHQGFSSRFIKLASDVIAKMPSYVVGRVMCLLGHRLKTIDYRPKILVIGVTYKKDIKDLRQSPAIDIIDLLRKRGVSVSYHDPLIPYLKLNHTININSLNLTAQNLKDFDCVIIAADHSALDYEFILKNSRLIFDTRNVYKNVNDKKIIRL